MNKAKKIMMLAACAVLLVCISVGATLAYLTDTEAVTNTFTLGQVGLDLDEAPVDANGKETTGTRVKANTYHLIPGKTYDKDPTVHVDDDSESCWLFVKVENGIADIEAEGDTSIDAQIQKNGWTLLKDNIYYQTYNEGDDKDFVVFESFTLKGNGLVNGTAGDGEISLDDYANKSVKITAYAVQLDGFNDSEKTDAVNAAAAWAAGNWN